MGRADIYRALAVKRSEERQMAAFIGQSSRRSYAGEIRRQLTANGYADRAITVDHATVLRRIDSHARASATEIRTGYNGKLRSFLNGLPRGLAETDVKARLAAEFLPATRLYNTGVKFPQMAGDLHEMARQDFYRENGIRCSWRIEPTDVADAKREDVCLRDIQKGTVSSVEEFEAERYPAHPRCPHRRIPVNVHPSTLPDEGAVWTGSG